MRHIACCMLLVGVLSLGSVNAQSAPAAVEAPWYDQVLDVVGAALGSVWAGIGGLFVSSDPYDHLPSQISEDDRRFIATLDAAGLTLAEIKVSGGIFSHSVYRFVASREPSDVDIQRAERKLQEYRGAARGLRAAAEQRILRAVLDVTSDRSFVLTAVIVELWPWPSVNYEMTARSQVQDSERRFNATPR